MWDPRLDFFKEERHQAIFSEGLPANLLIIRQIKMKTSMN
jgi:hypothetical protein